MKPTDSVDQINCKLHQLALPGEHNQRASMPQIRFSKPRHKWLDSCWCCSLWCNDVESIYHLGRSGAGWLRLSYDVELHPNSHDLGSVRLVWKMLMLSELNHDYQKHLLSIVIPSKATHKWYYSGWFSESTTKQCSVPNQHFGFRMFGATMIC